LEIDRIVLHVRYPHEIQDTEGERERETRDARYLAKTKDKLTRNLIDLLRDRIFTQHSYLKTGPGHPTTSKESTEIRCRLKILLVDKQSAVRVMQS
jgi:hypothetical protein